jgi:hypothetical protein
VERPVDNDEIDRLVKDLKAQKAAVVNDLTALRKKDTSLDQAISGLLGLRDDGAGPPAPPARPAGGSTVGVIPRGVEAIKIILSEAKEEMDTKRMVDELTLRGWRPNSANPHNAVSSNAARAAEMVPEIQRKRHDSGHYLYWWDASKAEPEVSMFDREGDQDSGQ